MGEAPQIFVRTSDGKQFHSWASPTAETPIAKLLESLLDEYPLSQHGPIDLVDESSGKLIDPEVSAGTVANRILAVRTRYVSDALGQLDALRVQEASAVDYFHEPGSSTIALNLWYPGIVRIDSSGGSKLVVKGSHRAMLTLPKDFPEKPPHILWLSPIFHPNLSADNEVWPMMYNWSDSPSVLTLVTALIDTVVGLTIHLGRRFSIRRCQVQNSRASNWYRRNRKAVASLAKRTRYRLDGPLMGRPLESTNVHWNIKGALTGGDPTVFLSRRAVRGILEIGIRNSGWLIGKQGRHGQAPWIFVERIVPLPPHGNSEAPANAVGVLRGEQGQHETPPTNDQLRPLDVHLQDGEPVLRFGSSLKPLTGYLVEVETVLPTEPTLQSDGVLRQPITVRGPYPEQARQLSQAHEPETSPEGARSIVRLHTKELEPPVCIYCGNLCFTDEEWGACVECGFIMHGECLHQLGGCPNTDCPRTALEPR